MKSELQKLFSKRLAEEMDARALSAKTLARIAGKMGHKIAQTSISNIRRGAQDPTLEKVEALSDALGVPTWFLLTEAGQIEQRIIRPVAASSENVVKLPNPYPKIFSRREDKVTEKARTYSKKK